MLKRLHLDHPARIIGVAFAVGILVGAGLLMLPVATQGPGGASFLTAVFTSTSAICVTGLIVVDTPTYWTHFGQVVIMGLIQIGGFGIMTLASVLALVVVRRLGLKTRLLAQAETGALDLGDVRRILKGVLALTLLFELLTAFVIAVRLATHYDYSPGSAIYRGIFHAVSSFNNAGFALWTDNLEQFVTDGWISLAICFAIIAGGLGFPVWLELRREMRRPRAWSLHTKITTIVTLILLAVGLGAMLAFEWNNPATMGPLDVPGKLLAGFFQGVQPRTAGFNTLDYGAMHDETQLIMTGLMYIGAGSAGTGGGIKVTTLALLAAHDLGRDPRRAGGERLRTEDPGVDPASGAHHRAHRARRGRGITLILIAVSPFTLTQSVFEAASAFGTVGLSTGITADVTSPGEIALIVLMYLGRIGPHTLGVALALRERARRIRYAEGRPIIG